MCWCEYAKKNKLSSTRCGFDGRKYSMLEVLLYCRNRAGSMGFGLRSFFQDYEGIQLSCNDKCWF
jgi:hypothetical protein